MVEPDMAFSLEMSAARLRLGEFTPANAPAHDPADTGQDAHQSGM